MHCQYTRAAASTMAIYIYTRTIYVVCTYIDHTFTDVFTLTCHNNLRKCMCLLMVFDSICMYGMEFLNSCPAPHSTPHPAQHCNKSLVCRAPHDAVILIINGNIQFVHPPTIIYFSVRRSGALKGYNIRGGPGVCCSPRGHARSPRSCSVFPPPATLSSLDPYKVVTNLLGILHA